MTSNDRSGQMMRYGLSLMYKSRIAGCFDQAAMRMLDSREPIVPGEEA